MDINFALKILQQLNSAQLDHDNFGSLSIDDALTAVTNEINRLTELEQGLLQRIAEKSTELPREPTASTRGVLSRRDYFAALAMQVLIIKIPLYDAEGEVGIFKEAGESIHTIRQEVAHSAVSYANALVEALSMEAV